MKKKHPRGLTPNAASALLYIAEVLAALLAAVVLSMYPSSEKAAGDGAVVTAGDLAHRHLPARQLKM